MSDKKHQFQTKCSGEPETRKSHTEEQKDSPSKRDRYHGRPVAQKIRKPGDGSIPTDDSIIYVHEADA
eukprot:NP_001021936.1 Uncharacterized protein CELE_C08E3.15 [Caenorhabditis elegans]